MTDNDTALIEIENATVYRGETRVFDGLSLRIPTAEPVAIVGPNGAGKTTLLKLITRELYPAHDGRSRVAILGREQWNVWELRSEIGVVSDDLRDRYPLDATGFDVALSGYFSSIGTHGMVARQVTGEQRQGALAALDRFGAARFADVPLARMSTGERRRCLLARAMVHDPATLILDEPTAGLDMAAAFDYLARMRRLMADGKNVVLVTHHLNEIPPEISRVVLLRAGRVIADGDKATVLTPPLLSRTFGTELRLLEQDGFFFAYPP